LMGLETFLHGAAKTIIASAVRRADGSTGTNLPETSASR
jgi:hypothetical protein